MAVDTTPSITVELPYVTARALWAAMRDDDQLAQDYVNLAVIHALNHLMKDVSPRWYSEEAWWRLTTGLKEANDGAAGFAEGMYERFMSYGDLPF